MNVGQSPEAYHRLLESLWRAGEPFINVEQDIVPWPGALALLEACPERWCGFAYSLSTEYGSYLGCVRFSRALLSERAGAFDAIAALPADGTPRRYWGRLDTRLKSVLDDAGEAMHVHWPSVGHLNPDQQLSGWYNCPKCGGEIPMATVRAQPWPYPCPRCDR